MADGSFLMNAMAVVFSLIAMFGVIGPAFGEGFKRKQEIGAPMDSRSNHVGVWVTGDGHIRHELLANGRYVEARGDVERAYEGSYKIAGNHIDYVDDTGFVADGDFKDGILYHAGMVFYRR